MSWPWEGFAASSANNYDYMNMPSTSKQNHYQPQSVVPYNMLSHPRELPPTKKTQRQSQKPSSTYKSASQAERERHMAKVESWLCRICDKQFNSKSGLNCHFTVVHMPKQPVAETRALSPYNPMGSYAPTAPYRVNPPSSCNICDKEFASRPGMLRHVKSVHEAVPKPAKTITKSRVSQKNTNVTINVYKSEYNKRQY